MESTRRAQRFPYNTIDDLIVHCRTPCTRRFRDQGCCICREDFADERCARLPCCRQIIGVGCLRQWLAEDVAQGNCPHCRQRLVERRRPTAGLHADHRQAAELLLAIQVNLETLRARVVMEVAEEGGLRVRRVDAADNRPRTPTGDSEVSEEESLQELASLGIEFD